MNVRFTLCTCINKWLCNKNYRFLPLCVLRVVPSWLIYVIPSMCVTLWYVDTYLYPYERLHVCRDFMWHSLFFFCLFYTRRNQKFFFLFLMYKHKRNFLNFLCLFVCTFVTLPLTCVSVRVSVGFIYVLDILLTYVMYFSAWGKKVKE